MKQLVLMRHAKSSWGDSGLADHDRPLSGRGLRDAPRMGKRLAAQGIAPDLLLSSSALRARQTAELVAGALGPSSPATRIEPGIYLATPGELIGTVASLDDAVGELLLVGHNPGLTQLANILLPGLGLHNLPTAGVVAIECDTDRWAGIDSAAFRLRFYDYPKNPKAVS